MTETPVDIPNRAAFRASEVCEIAQIPPYVLRSWEKEFPGLGAAARPGGPRIYRRSDVEQILRIKHLVYAEGLTLAGVRRRLEGEPPAEEELLAAPPAVSLEVRSRVDRARRELRELLEMLSEESAGSEPQPAAEAGAAESGAEPVAPEAQEGVLASGDHAAVELPLLNGVLDTPPKPRRARRAGRQAPWGGSTEVE